MNREEIVQKIIDSGIVAIVRVYEEEKVLPTAEALIEGGIYALEVTMVVPNALEIISKLDKEFGDSIMLGVGSVLNAETAVKAIDAGAKYVVSPIFDIEILKTSHKLNAPIMPGCYTPTEIFNAQEAGADIVKIFPADKLGMGYIKAIKAPMPHLNVMPTGGVTLTNAGEWINAGACAVGVGSALTDNAAIKEGNFGKLKENAKIIIENIKNR